MFTSMFTFRHLHKIVFVVVSVGNVFASMKTSMINENYTSESSLRTARVRMCTWIHGAKEIY